MDLAHISTISVSGSKMKNGLAAEFTENDIFIGQIYDDNIYRKSKFLSEKEVLSGVSRGLKARIFRVGNLTAGYRDNVFQKNPLNNAFLNTIGGLMDLEAIPQSLCDNHFEFTPVDLCTEAILKMSQVNCDHMIAHVFNPSYVKVDELKEAAENLNRNIMTVADVDFERMMKEKPSGQIAALISDSLDMKPSIHVTNKITVEILKQCDFEWPEMDLDYLTGFIKTALKTVRGG